MSVNLLVMLIMAIVYFVGMIVLGWVASRWIKSVADYFASGREIGWIVLGFSAASIMISGTTLSAIPGLAIESGFWTGFNFMFSSAVGMAVFGLTLARVVRRSGIYTVPEWLRLRFDERSRAVATISVIIALFFTTMAQIVGLAAIVSPITGWPFWLAAVISTLVFLIYLYVGGLWAVVVTTVVQAVIVCVGLALTYVWTWTTYGSWGDILAKTANVAAIGDLGGRGGFFALTYPSAITVAVIWLLLWYANQENWIRAIGARSERDIAKGLVFAGVIITVFFTAGLVMLGYYAMVAIPDIAPGGKPINPGVGYGAYGMLATIMPPWLGGIALIVGLSAAMSTASVILVAAGSIVMRDIYGRYFRPHATPEQMLLPSRIFTTLFGLVALVASVTTTLDAGFLLSLMFTFCVPPMVPVIVGMLWRRVTPTASFWSMTLSCLASLIWLFYPSDPPLWAGSAHMLWVAFIVGLVVLFVVTPFTKPKYYGEKEFGRAEPVRPAGEVA